MTTSELGGTSALVTGATRLLPRIGRTQALDCWERRLARTGTPSGRVISWEGE